MVCFACCGLRLASKVMSGRGGGGGVGWVGGVGVVRVCVCVCVFVRGGGGGGWGEEGRIHTGGIIIDQTFKLLKNKSETRMTANVPKQDPHT